MTQKELGPDSDRDGLNRTVTELQRLAGHGGILSRPHGGCRRRRRRAARRPGVVDAPADQRIAQAGMEPQRRRSGAATVRAARPTPSQSLRVSRSADSESVTVTESEAAQEQQSLQELCPLASDYTPSQ